MHRVRIFAYRTEFRDRELGRKRHDVTFSDLESGE